MPTRASTHSHTLLPHQPRRQQNAGAFMGPDIMAPIPMRTLDQEYDDHPVEPEDDRVPPPERPGLVKRAVDRVLRRTR